MERRATQSVLGEDGEPIARGRATFGGPDETYRYRLERTWDPTRPRCLFLMLNPSIGTEEQEDPTLRRCARFAGDWGYGGFIVCNLFALRSTDPSALYAHPNPVGPENDHYILAAHEEAPLTVLAWGEHGAHLGRSARVLQLLEASGKPVHALAVNASGEPGHPLYLRADLTPRPFQRSPAP